VGFLLHNYGKNYIGDLREALRNHFKIGTAYINLAILEGRKMLAMEYVAKNPKMVKKPELLLNRRTYKKFPFLFSGQYFKMRLLLKIPREAKVG